MPRISERASRMPSSPIRKLVPFADKAKARGVKIYHLNIGQPDIATPQEGLDALKNIDRKVLEYSPSDGLLSVRQKMVEYYSRSGIEVTPQEIIVTSGGSEGLLFVFMACMSPGDEIVVSEPTYANYIAFAESAGVRVRTVRTSIEDNYALPSIDKFEEVINEHTKAILICNPNNPTGYLYTREELEQISALVKKYDLFLISDEVYREFNYTDYPYVSVMDLKGIEENVIMVDSVSKRYSECGIRIGMVVTHNKEVRDHIMRYAQARLSPPLLGQLVAQASIDASEEYMKSVYDEYVSRRDLLIAGLNAISGVRTPMPNGSFYTFAELPVDDSDKFCQWMLDEFEYEGQTVMMAPGTGFYANPEAGRRQVRIAYVLNKEELTQALIILEKGLAAYPGATN